MQIFEFYLPVEWLAPQAQARERQSFISVRQSRGNNFNPISHGVFDRDNIMGGVLKTHSLKPDLALFDHYANHTM